MADDEQIEVENPGPNEDDNQIFFGINDPRITTINNNLNRIENHINELLNRIRIENTSNTNIRSAVRFSERVYNLQFDSKEDLQRDANSLLTNLSTFEEQIEHIKEQMEHADSIFNNNKGGKTNKRNKRRTRKSQK